MLYRTYFLASLGLAACQQPRLGAPHVPSQGLPFDAPSLASAALWRAPLQGATGRKVNLESIAEAAPLVVILWAPWCESCVKERPALQRLDAWAKAHGGFRVVSVRIDPESSAPGLAGDSGVSIELNDAGDRFAALGQRRVPTTMVFDADGTLVYSGGALDARALQVLKRLLGQKIVPFSSGSR
jgi:thiol-disulfide isomerase/thioredoxin